MHALLSSYLFQYKKCPLPGAGCLFIERTPALIVTGEKLIRAPHEKIVFVNEERDCADLAEFIAANKDISISEAAYLLKKVSAAINDLKQDEHYDLPAAGKFARSTEGELIFLAERYDAAMLPDLPIEKFIRPDSAHQILVGDTETTNHAMTEYYSDKPVSIRRRWLSAAALLLIVGLALIIYYISDENANRNFGNAHKLTADSVSAQYSTAP